MWNLKQMSEIEIVKSKIIRPVQRDHETIFGGPPKHTLYQTDTPAITRSSIMCSGSTLNPNIGPDGYTIAKQALTTPGNTYYTLSPSSTGPTACIMWETASGVPGVTSWPAGSYQVNLNIVVQNPLITWNSCYVCRCDVSGASQATVGSSSPNVALTTVGVYSTIVSGVAQTAASTDRIYWVLTFSSLSNAYQFAFKSSVTLTYPF